MTKEEKLVVIDSLAEQLQAYPHFYIADIESLNAEQTAALRRKCFESDVKLVVVKNTLLGKALEKVEKADADLVKVLEGPTSIMFTNVAKAPAVLIKEFRKKSEKPVLKAAFAEGCVYVGDDQLDALCNIKSKEELIADIVALLQSPAKNVISALQANAGQKIAGPRVVPQARPEFHHGFVVSGRKNLNRRKGHHKARKVVLYHRNLRLLQHDLRDPAAVGVCNHPRQTVPPASLLPGDQCPGKDFGFCECVFYF